MFNLCTFCYQAVLLRQRWNDLHQQCAIMETARKNAFHLAWTEITEVILSMIKVARRQFRMPLLRGIQQKENWWPKREPYQCGPPVGIVYKDNFKNFFQMVMFFLAHAVTFWGRLHFTKNYFFTVNTSV